MGRPTTRNTDTLTILYEIEIAVEKFKKLNAKATTYTDRAKKVKGGIFARLDEIPKEDFALYSEKIERITNRLTQIKHDKKDNQARKRA